MKKALLAGLAGLLIAAPAAAQDAQSWTGPYVGGQIGYGLGADRSGETIEFDTNLDGTFGDTVNTAAGANAFSPGFCGGAATGATPGSGCDGDEDDVHWALHLGYDMQMSNNVVLGLVAEYGQTRVTDSVAAFSTTPAFYTITRQLRDNGALRARIGYALGDTLVYATGGVAYGKIRNRFETSNTANTFTNNGNDDAWGYRVGGGFEQRISQGFSIGAQYLFTSLNDDDYRVRAAGPAPATNPFIRVNAAGTDFRRSNDDFNVHTVALTANFRF